MRLLEVWAKRRDWLKENEIVRECGYRNSGLEYRLMVEHGTIIQEGSVVPNWVLWDIEEVYLKLYEVYPEEMEALLIKYKLSLRKVRFEMGITQHRAHYLVKRGELMILGGLGVKW